MAKDGSRKRRMARLGTAAMAVGLTAVTSLVVRAPLAAALDQAGHPCTATLQGLVRTDTRTGGPVQCAPGDGGLRWRPVATGTRSASATATTTTVPPSPTTTVARPAGAPVDGGRCGDRAEGDLTLAPSSGATLVCTATDDGRRWVARPPGAIVAPTTSWLPTPSIPARSRARVTDSLPAGLGDPTGLPPGVGLPPGAVTRPLSPQRYDALDWWKTSRWLTEADVPGIDTEAVNDHFVAACDALGWRHEPRRVQRLPDGIPPGRWFMSGAKLLIGSCRTWAGSVVDGTRRRPWVLAWSATVRAGGSSIELVVELRDTPPDGGRPA